VGRKNLTGGGALSTGIRVGLLSRNFYMILYKSFILFMKKSLLRDSVLYPGTLQDIIIFNGDQRLSHPKIGGGVSLVTSLQPLQDCCLWP